jgi:hypothetical protein
LEDFFWALYRVAASLTRWLPCSLVKTAAKLGEDFGEHTMLLGVIHLDLAKPTSIHHRQVGP